MVFTMRQSLKFNKFTVNRMVLYSMILFWNTVIQKGHCEASKVQPKFKERESTVLESA
jgi:hypothetical protein